MNNSIWATIMQKPYFYIMCKLEIVKIGENRKEIKQESGHINYYLGYDDAITYVMLGRDSSVRL